MTEICVICEVGTATEQVRDRDVNLNGRTIRITDDRFFECDNCKEAYYTSEQARIASRKACDIRRRDERLLTSDQIKRIRRSLFLSQDQLESALGVSKKTVVRWENGTAAQSKALDDVLRLIELDSDNLRMLVLVRDAALAPIVEQRLSTQDDKQTIELKEAVYAGLEQADVESSLVNAVTESVVSAIVSHKRERLKRFAIDSEGVVA